MGLQQRPCGALQPGKSRMLCGTGSVYMKAMLLGPSSVRGHTPAEGGLTRSEDKGCARSGLLWSSLCLPCKEACSYSRRGLSQWRSWSRGCLSTLYRSPYGSLCRSRLLSLPLSLYSSLFQSLSLPLFLSLSQSLCLSLSLLGSLWCSSRHWLRERGPLSGDLLLERYPRCPADSLDSLQAQCF